MADWREPSVDALMRVRRQDRIDVQLYFALR
jgi:hypothetical protein